MFVSFVKLQLMVCRVSCLARRVVTREVSRSDVALLMSFERDVREISWFVWTQLAFEDSLRFVVIHHVLFQQHSRTKNFVTNRARRFLNAMSVAHVIEERPFSWAGF